MPRYVAFLRGVSPMNAKMADLRECFDKLDFTDVKTVLSSGNVVFMGGAKSETSLAKTLEVGMAKHLPRSFPVIVRKLDHLLALLKSDPYSGFRISPNAKRVFANPCVLHRIYPRQVRGRFFRMSRSIFNRAHSARRRANSILLGTHRLVTHALEPTLFA